MLCSLESLRQKEVIDIQSGERLGFIDDVELDTDTSAVTALLIYGRPRLLGLLGREEDIAVPCSAIEVIGRETVLVRLGDSSKRPNRRGVFSGSLFE